MGVLQAMWDSMTGGRQEARKAEQAEVDQALKVTRATTRTKLDGLNNEVDGLRGSEARMLAYFNGLQAQVSRGRQGR